MPAWKKVITSGSQAQLAGVTGSFTGSFVGNGSGLTGISAGGGGIFAATGSFQSTTNDLQITGSLQATGGITGSFTGSFDGNFSGSLLATDYKQDTSSGTGSFQITGSLIEYDIDTFDLDGTMVLSGSFIQSGSLLQIYNHTLYTTGSYVTLASNTTGSHNAMFVDYTATSGSILRAGSLTLGYHNTLTSLVETYTEIGNSSDLSFTGSIDGSNIILAVSSSTIPWSIKMSTKYL